MADIGWRLKLLAQHARACHEHARTVEAQGCPETAQQWRNLRDGAVDKWFESIEDELRSTVFLPGPK